MSELGQHPNNPSNSENTPESQPRNMRDMMTWADVPEQQHRNLPFDNTSLEEAVELPEFVHNLSSHDVTAEHFTATERQPAAEPTPDTTGNLPSKRSRVVRTIAVIATAVTAAGIYLGTGGDDDASKNEIRDETVATETYDSQPEAASVQEASLPTAEFSSNRPYDQWPESVVEQGLFQNLTPDVQEKIRTFESMNVETFRNQSLNDQLAYSNFLMKAAAPQLANYYTENKDSLGFPSISTEAIDSLTEANIDLTADPQTISDRLTLIQIGATGMFEQYTHQDLENDSDRYSQGNNKDIVFNKIEAKKIMSAYGVFGVTGNVMDSMGSDQSKPVPAIEIRYRQVVPSEVSGVFDSINFSIIPSGATGLNPAENYRMRAIHTVNLNDSRSEYQDIVMEQKYTDFDGTSRSTVLLVRRDEVTSTSGGMTDASLFDGPGYGYK